MVLSNVIDRFRLRCIAGLLLLWLGVLTACADSGPTESDLVLIRVGSHSVTLAQFKMARELELLAYPYQMRRNREAMHRLHRRLLKSMVEELLAAERASELGITVDDDQLAAAVAAVTEDYPKGEFEKTLLDCAVPLAFWKERLRARLLMQRVIDAELDDGVAVTQEELQQFMGSRSAEGGSLDTLTDAQIVVRVRRIKFEKAYTRWLADLKQRFPAEINPSTWQRLEQPRNSANSG